MINRKIMKICTLITCIVLAIGMISSKKIDIFAEGKTSVSVPVGSADGTNTEPSKNYIDENGVLHINSGQFYDSFVQSNFYNDINPYYNELSDHYNPVCFNKSYIWFIKPQGNMQILPVIVKNSKNMFKVYMVGLSKDYRYPFYVGGEEYSSNIKFEVDVTSPRQFKFREYDVSVIGNKQYYYSIKPIYFDSHGFSVLPFVGTSRDETASISKESLYKLSYYFNPSVACISSDNLENFEDICKEWMQGKILAVNVDKFNINNGFNLSKYSGWIGESPSLVEFSQMKLNGIDFNRFFSVFTSTGYTGGNNIDTPPTPNPGGGTTVPGGGTSPTPPNPPGGGSGGSGGSGGGSSGIDYSSLLSNILAKLDSINQSIQSGDFKAILNNFTTIVSQLSDIKKISSSISNGIGQLQQQLDLIIDNLTNIHCNFSDVNIVQSIKDNTDRVINKLNELLNKEVKVDFDQTVNKDGTNFWDFLKSLVDGLTEVLKNLLDFGSSILDKLFDILDKLVSWLCDNLLKLFIPTGDYKEKMESQIDKLKKDSGFVWQSIELLGTLKDTLEGANVQTTGAEDSNTKFTFTWSDVSFMGQTLIPAGSAHPQEYIDSLGFHDVQDVCNQICDALLLYGAILFVISQLKGYFE